MSQNETKSKYKQLVETCDSLIRQGQVYAAVEKVRQINISRVPREYALPLAKICRRAGLVKPGLRLLFPIVRSDKKAELPATPFEICEYAVLLSRNGSVNEANQLLMEVDPAVAPEAVLYQAYCHIMNWDYALAVDFLLQYLHTNQGGYDKLVAQVNLASAHLALNQLDEAEPLLETILAHAREANATRLIGNCLEMQGNLLLQRGDYEKSRTILEQAETILNKNQVNDQLVLMKWKAFIDATATQTTQPLEAFRQEAIGRGHWESVRDADFLALKIKFDQKRFDHLIFGSSKPAFRDRVLHELPAMPSTYYVLGTDSGEWMDIASGEVHGVHDLNAGKKIHQLISSLTMDFYSPRNTGELFSDLYPGEHFDINSSPNRVRQIIARTRDWLSENSLAAEIIQNDGDYHFSILGPFGVRVTLDRSVAGNLEVKFRELNTRFATGNQPFTVEDVANRLGLARSGAYRLVRWAVESGNMSKQGSGSGTTYRILKRAA